MSSKNTKGKLRKILNKECPECESENLQLRECEGHSIEVCPSCGYEEEDKTLNKNNIKKLREAKNEELGVRQK
jgi:Zn ribbon nucleic-acid-binding protein